MHQAVADKCLGHVACRLHQGHAGSPSSHGLTERRVGAFDLREYKSTRVAVVILARNEARSIADAVTGSRPYAHEVVVMDGRSTDGTVELARAAGATVYQDPGLGKGSAIRRSFELVEADVIVMMDAD